MTILFQDTGRDPCPLYEDVFIDWKVTPEKRNGYTWFEVSCSRLSEGICKVTNEPCPGDKIQERLGLLRLGRASIFLYDHPFRRKDK